MSRSLPTAVTRLLQRWRGGEREALDELTPKVYGALRDIARRHMRSERTGHTLQATALVHEAFVRLVDMEVDWQDRAHFYAVAARAMRRILVDRARARLRAKRGGGQVRLTLDERLVVAGEPSTDLVALDEALHRLAEFDPRKSRAVELHYFGGMSYDETAVAMDVSRATVQRELKLAKAWLYHELRRESPHAP